MTTECHIVIEPYAFNKIRITKTPNIVINGHPLKRSGGWTLEEIIEAAAFEVKEKSFDGQLLAYGEWHEQIFLERFEQTGPNRFELGFGS